MVTISVWKIVAAFIAAMGIPSAITGLIVWNFERKLAKRDAEKEEREQGKEELEMLMVEMTSASIALGEATARAVQRIPDAHCNGDMHAALEYATEIKHRQREFLAKQGIKALC